MGGFFSYGKSRDAWRFFCSGAHMDKDSKEALQVTKELVAKFIETRNISPGNFAEVFPAIYQVVLTTICPEAKDKKD